VLLLLLSLHPARITPDANARKSNFFMVFFELVVKLIWSLGISDWPVVIGH
jgi:hypothetical protein